MTNPNQTPITVEIPLLPLDVPAPYHIRVREQGLGPAVLADENLVRFLSELPGTASDARVQAYLGAFSMGAKTLRDGGDVVGVEVRSMYEWSQRQNEDPPKIGLAT